MTIIEELAKNKTVEQIARNLKVDNNDVNDLSQMIYLYLLEYDEDKIKQMYDNNQLNFFITRLLINQYYSKTSKFYYLYKYFNNKRDMNITLNDGENDDDE